MAQETKDTEHREMTEEHGDRIEQLELETKGMVATSKIWIYVIIGLLLYMVFLVIPNIDEKGLTVSTICLHIFPYCPSYN